VLRPGLSPAWVRTTPPYPVASLRISAALADQDIRVCRSSEMLITTGQLSSRVAGIRSISWVLPRLRNSRRRSAVFMMSAAATTPACTPILGPASFATTTPIRRHRETAHDSWTPRRPSLAPPDGPSLSDSGDHRVWFPGSSPATGRATKRSSRSN